jgi:hypothetical protein
MRTPLCSVDWYLQSAFLIFSSTYPDLLFLSVRSISCQSDTTSVSPGMAVYHNYVRTIFLCVILANDHGEGGKMTCLA